MAPDFRFLVAFLALLGSAHAEELLALASPDGANSITLHLDEAGVPSYQVTRKGKTVIASSPLGLRCNDQDFSRGLKLESKGEKEERRERYALTSGAKPQVDQLHHRQSVVFMNASGARLTVDLDAGNEGVAFRYRFPEEGAERTIEEELSGFRLPGDAQGWISPYNSSSSSSPAYEDYYFPVKPGDPPPYSRGGDTRGWYFPALFRTGDAWTLLTESGTDANYCGCHLGPDSKDGVYRIAFPFTDEGTRRVKHREDTKPRHSLPWTMPWRVIATGDSAGDILGSTLVTDLAEPSKIADTSWIKPGRASWSWWAYPEGQNSTDLYASFIDAAKDRTWEYSLLDAGWWKADTRKLVELGKEKGIGLHVWAHAESFYDANRRKQQLDSYADLGVKGAKIDFWCTDRQEAMEAMTATLQDAAERKLMINLHGCTLPRGWQRTWPNFMTAEAVLGSESYMYDERYTEKAAELNTILPFTRNVAGPMDYTPFGLAEKRYARKTTAAHEFAASLIFNSGIVHYADRPEAYASFPDAARQVLREAPARWDETRCLIGEPGSAVVLARRSGDIWFVTGINGQAKERPIDLDLGAFADFKKRTLIREGADAKMQLATENIEAGDKWQHVMPARGGFILRLER
ncbi:glycoside hydrolase family 97 protein [Luteolibacter luteus]|uniref:Glycoside hydrolase family 97 protein n=1 Tax=Luteolibacter luteus TaxID=2728835 RepID=A0A858RFP5_9BACT|nr:glycoside hydrolase family 97 protein [Luteolibacter luteus]QJE95572.1 glycoside hydrolase family 97 protein [Luteolibacter luteus]